MSAAFDQFTSHKTNSSVLAIIPARGGSKGIPRKNIQPVANEPLISYTIKVALAAQNIDRVLVSTDDKEIAFISKSYGADVPFLRPCALAGDNAEIGAAIEFTRKKLAMEEAHYEHIVTLYPTHIFRTVQMIESLVALLKSGYSSVITAKRVEPCQFGFVYLEKGHPIHLRDHGGSTENNSYVRPLGLFTGRNHNFGANMLTTYYHIVEEPLSLVDIDTVADMFFADEILKANLFDFGL